VGVGRRRWLTTVSRDGGGGLAAVPSGEEAEGRKCGRLREENKSWNAPGCAVEPRRGTVSWSSYWWPAARVAAAGDGGVTWRGGEKPSGVGRAASGRAGGPGGGVMMRTSTTTRVHLRQQHLFRRHQMLLHLRHHLLLGQSLGPVQEN
jgi:hypothetical protein